MKRLDRMVARVSKLVQAHAHPHLVRTLLMADGFLALVNPLWASFLLRRYTGSWKGGWALPPRGWRYMFARLNDERVPLVPLFQDEGQGPRLKTECAERADWAAPGSCNDCQRCCHVQGASGELIPCPMLTPAGCAVFGTLAWQYGPCGRFPESPERIEAFGCPRFEFREETDGEGRRRVHLPLAP
jgi:hypothetical protein